VTGNRTFPKGLKPAPFTALDGAAEAAPFQSQFGELLPVYLFLT